MSRRSLPSEPHPDVKNMEICIQASNEAGQLISALLAFYEEINQGFGVKALTKMEVINRMMRLTTSLAGLKLNESSSQD